MWEMISPNFFYGFYYRSAHVERRPCSVGIEEAMTLRKGWTTLDTPSLATFCIGGSSVVEQIQGKT